MEKFLKSASPHETSVWSCLNCTFSNFEELSYCEICETTRAVAPKAEERNATTGLISSLCNDKVLSSRCVFFSPHPYHFNQEENWSCGYRNIQMLTSSLLQIPEFRTVLFDGTNKIPTVPELQLLIENVWKNGFDVEGGLQLKNKLFGTRKWIGTTECAALLRFFGLRAIVVDFIHSPPQDMSSTSLYNISKSMTMSDRITHWLQRYTQIYHSTIAIDLETDRSSKRQKTTETTPFPLYFQHAGHSRTIIGFRKSSLDANKIESVLLFDPKYNGYRIRESILGQGKKKWWQYLSLPCAKIRNEDLQMVVVLPGIMTTEERDRSKSIVGLTDDMPIQSNI